MATSVVTDNTGRTFLVDFSTNTRYALTDQNQIQQAIETYGTTNSFSQLEPEYQWRQNELLARLGAAPVDGVSLDVRLGFTDGGPAPAISEVLEPRATTDFRSEAAAMFPWLTGSLLDSFAGFWADSGSSTAALGRLRNTSEYDRVFAGIKRADGTLRMDENAYFSTKAGFREALAEFGKDPAAYESRFVKAIENEMGADELMRGMGDAFQRFFEPGSNSDGGLFDTFLDNFVNSGSAVTALDAVRNSAAYDAVFQGNRRDDGTIRMDEPEWFAYKRGWTRTLAGFGLNPDEFMARDRLRESVAGEVSIQELNQRLQATQDGIIDNIDAVRNFYAQGYGLELTAESILGMAIDPDVQRDVLERRITAGQIGGEASVQGFLRDVDRAEALARLGVTQSQARELYGNAARRLPGISAATSRFNLGATTIDNYEDTIVGQDAAQGLRIERGLQREESSFSRTLDTRGDDFGLSGLRQR